MARWHPLLSGALAREAREAVEAIAAALPVPAEADLARGAAGVAVFHHYRGEAARADAAIDRAFEIVASSDLEPGLFGGFVGVAWTNDHLCMHGETNEDVDAVLLQHVAHTPWVGSYDLIGGLVGFGIYAAKRREHPLGARLLSEIVARLGEVVIPIGPGLALHTPSEKDGVFNTGVAHGVPGAIGFLGGLSDIRAQDLARTLADWLASLRRHAPDGSLYPNRHPTLEPGCRAAWCYGDPGIAAALLRAARVGGILELEKLALEAGRAAAARAVDRAGVVDAGLCHGAAGLLQVFNRLYQATGEPAFHAAAVRWAERTLALTAALGGVASYLPYQRKLDQRAVYDPGFLTGTAGIGLALQAAISAEEPSWDAVLAIDVPTT